MGTLASIVSGTTTGAAAATTVNALVNAQNAIGQYSHNATVALTTTPAALTISTNDTQAGAITHSISVNPTRFTNTSTLPVIGMFVVQPQISHLTTGAGSATFWLRLNGTTAIANSAAIFQMGAVIGSGVLNIVVPVTLAVNDYVEVMCVASANSEHQTTYTAASGSGATAVPASPSIIVTVTALPA